MDKIYAQFAEWQQINKAIPLEKFYEGERMTEKQKNAFIDEVSSARILYKKDETHVIELQINNIYPRNRFIYGWVRAVFQTMPYEIILILNCRYKYYLFLTADTQDRKNTTSIFTYNVVTNIYSNGVWIDRDNFQKHELEMWSEPVDWNLFPSYIRKNTPSHTFQFIDDNGNKIAVPYPARHYVRDSQIDEYISFAQKEYEINNIQNNLDHLCGEELEYALSDFWGETERYFRSQHDNSVWSFNPLADEADDKDASDFFFGFIDGKPMNEDDYEKYLESYKKD